MSIRNYTIKKQPNKPYSHIVFDDIIVELKVKKMI